MRFVPIVFCLSLAACAASPPQESPAASPASPADGPVDLAASQPAPERELFEDWQQGSAWNFEQRVAALELGLWNAQALAELQGALSRQDLSSVRAAVLLAHGGELSREILLRRLESRARAPSRAADAGDVVAGAALRRWKDDDTSARLAALAVGDGPHPDLEVRVECAALALDGGHHEVVPFLLRVLSAGTPGELRDPIDWPPTETLAWAKQRAAAALFRRAGLPNSFRPDGSFEAQAEARRALEERLLAPR